MAIMSEREGKRGGEGVWETWEKGLQRPREAGIEDQRVEPAASTTICLEVGRISGFAKNYRKINYRKKL